MVRDLTCRVPSEQPAGLVGYSLIRLQGLRVSLFLLRLRGGQELQGGALLIIVPELSGQTLTKRI